MAQADWTVLDGSLGAGNVIRGATGGFAPPPGGDQMVYGFNSLDVSQGAVGLFCNRLNFAPMAKGGTIEGCVKRGLSGGPTGFAPFFYMQLQGPSIGDNAYLLGIADGDPAHLVLRKGTLATGLPDLAPQAPDNGILRRSTATVPVDTWVHLRLDVIVNTNGDVRLVVFQNDLALHPLNTAPDWKPVPGMTDTVGGVSTSFVDDVLGVNSGSPPLTSGRAGWAFWTRDVTRRAFVDHVRLTRQT